MSAAELRKAADTLRHRAEQVTRHSSGGDLWFDADVDLRNAIAGTFLGNKDSAWDDARWIATMHPGVGLALADWLDDAANWESTPHTVNYDMRAHDIARLINGGAS